MYGQTIKALRAHLGWSQQKLAKRIGVNPSTVRQWEKGQTEPHGAALKALESLEYEVGQHLFEPKTEPR